MGSPASGQYASVKNEAGSCIAEANAWTLDKECILHEYRTCETPSDGGMGIVSGAKRHSGSFSGLYDPPEEWFDEGDRMTLKLYVDADVYYEGIAVIEKITIGEVDIQEGGIVPWSASFKAHGLFTLKGGTYSSGS